MDDLSLIVPLEPLEKCYDSYNPAVPDTPVIAALKVQQAGERAELYERQSQERIAMEHTHRTAFTIAGLAEQPSVATVVDLD